MALTEHDRMLLTRCLQREASAWREFVDQFAGLFVHVIHHTSQARSVQLDNSDVDDLCAEIFVSILYDNLAILRRFRGDSSLATYLTVIARRIIVREVTQRRMAEAMGHVKSHSVNVEMAHAESSATTRIENQELVERMLEGLPPHEAKVVRQFHLEGKSYREISEGLGVPENSIGPTLTRAREKLRQSVSASLG